MESITEKMSQLSMKRKFSEIETITSGVQNMKVVEPPIKKVRIKTYDEWCIENGYPPLREQIEDYWMDYEDHERLKRLFN